MKLVLVVPTTIVTMAFGQQANANMYDRLNAPLKRINRMNALLQTLKVDLSSLNLFETAEDLSQAADDLSQAADDLFQAVEDIVPSQDLSQLDCETRTNEYWSKGMMQCLCSQGYYRSEEDQCVSCPENTVGKHSWTPENMHSRCREIPDFDTPNDCAPNEYWSKGIMQCLCSQGSYRSEADQCVSCPENAEEIHSWTHETMDARCKCIPPFDGPDCSQCLPQFVGQDCSQCMDPSLSKSSECVCVEGLYLDEGGDCKSCENGGKYNGQICECCFGYKGSLCETKMELSAECNNRGSYEYYPGSPPPPLNCECYFPYYGDTCDSKYAIVTNNGDGNIQYKTEDELYYNLDNDWNYRHLFLYYYTYPAHGDHCGQTEWN